MISRIVSLLLLLTVCSSAMGFSVRTESWSEDVVLHDGKTIKVEREVEWTFRVSSGDAGSGFALFKNWPDRFWLKFTHPDTQKTIKWQGEQHFRPVLLDIVNGVPYLVVYGHSTKETESIYGCPELPYIYLQYDLKNRGKWNAIPQDKAPEILKNANLAPEYPDSREKKHLSADDVQRMMPRVENSSAHNFQKIIPRTYNEWRYSYKNNHLNERKQGDCRPRRAPLPQVVLPTAIEGTSEILETINYTPDRIAVGDDWSNLVFDQKREGECKKLFRPTDPNDYMQGQRFINDSTGSKPAPYSRTAQFNMGVRMLCDDHVWFVTHQEEPGKIVISKFTATGDLVYRTSFRNPDRVEGFVSYIRIPSLRPEGGYLYFDWLDFRDINREWHIKRWLKMRLREPASQNDGRSK
jgi:hypothetical protein